MYLGLLSSKTESSCLLTFIYTIEDVAVMEYEAWRTILFCPELSQHEVKAEYLHLLDALATLPLDIHIE